MREHTRKNNRLVAKLKAQMDAAVTMTGYIDPRHGGSINRNPNYLVYWAVIDEKGETYHDSSWQCHVGLNYSEGVQKYFLLNRLQFGNAKRPLPDEIIDEYLLYITKHSPYKDAFYRKGGKKVREYGYVVMDTTVPANYMASALVALRMIWEYPGIPFLWSKLVKEGVHPDVAYCHAYQVSCNDLKTVSTNESWSHTSWDGHQFTNKMVKNFIRNKIKVKNAPYVEGGKYAPMCFMYGDPAAVSYLRDKTLACHEQAKKKKKGTNNIFNQGNQRDNVNVDDFIPLWAEMLKENYGNVEEWVNKNG
jgi:hypothetical protein